MKEIFLLLGSNRGDRKAYLEKARTMIVEECGPVIRSSSLFETEPWKFKDEIPFINQVIEIDSTLNPEELMEKLLTIETRLGRIRPFENCDSTLLASAASLSKGSGIGDRGSARTVSADRERSEPYSGRTIDIDILFFGSKMIFTEHLMIPHPRLHERRFTLEPLNEITPTFQHPVLKKTISVLLQNCRDPHKVAQLA